MGIKSASRQKYNIIHGPPTWFLYYFRNHFTDEFGFKLRPPSYGVVLTHTAPITAQDTTKPVLHAQVTYGSMYVHMTRTYRTAPHRTRSVCCLFGRETGQQAKADAALSASEIHRAPHPSPPKQTKAAARVAQPPRD